ncbi:MAG: hypothetical protein RIB61_06525 [Roseicyclus sp.]|jgi:hypothetical protein
MPSLTYLATRYLAWLVGLSFLYGLLVAYAGLPNTLATGVILAAVPATDVGMQAARRASRALTMRDMAVIWAVCLLVFVVLRLVVPAVLFAPVRSMLADPEGLRTTLTVLASTAAMLALFLAIGKRSVPQG